MKTFVMAAVAATVAAGSAFAHPVNEPHVCGIDPDMVMDWPASNWVSENTGQIYDKGAYFFIATNDLKGGMDEYTTTHTRIFKDDCRVVDTEIFHANDDAAGGGSLPMWSWDADTRTLSFSYGDVVGNAVFPDTDSFDFTGVDMAAAIAAGNKFISDYVNKHGITEAELQEQAPLIAAQVNENGDNNYHLHWEITDPDRGLQIGVERDGEYLSKDGL